MARLSRLALGSAAWLLAAVAVAFAWLWVRSYGRAESIGFSHNAPPGPTAVDWGVHLASARGVVTLTRYIDQYTDLAVIAAQGRRAANDRWHWYAVGKPTLLDGPVGLHVGHNAYAYGTNDNESVTVPHGAVCLALATPAVVAVVRRRRRRGRARAGLCKVCGYDVRATPGRCPECGSMPAAI